MVQAIIIDMIPFLTMLFLITFSFSLALYLLIKFQVEHLYASDTSGEWLIAYEDWSTLSHAVYTTFNMGMYAAWDARALKLDWQTIVVFEAFMIIVQVRVRLPPPCARLAAPTVVRAFPVRVGRSLQPAHRDHGRHAPPRP